jgi:hypothetical protein
MIETTTLLRAAVDCPLVGLPGGNSPAVVVEQDSAHTILAGQHNTGSLQGTGNAEPSTEIEDFCGRFAEIDRKFVSACESHAIEFRYPQNGRRVDTLERES